MRKSIKFRPKWWVFEALRDFKSQTVFVTGGLGAGKTDGAVTWHHDRVTRNPKSQFSWFFEPTHNLIASAAVPKYKKHLERIGYKENVHFKVTKSPFYKITYLVGCGHEVHFHSFERPELIVAVEISHATLDEAANAQTREAFENIDSRIRCPNSNLRQFLVTGATQGINWLAEECDSDTLDGWDKAIERDHFHYDKKYRRFTLWTDDNADNLPEEYIPKLERIYGHNPNLIKSRRFGLFCPLVDGAAYSNYRTYHDIDDVQPDPYADIDLTFDFNANPVAWVAVQKLKIDPDEPSRRDYVSVHECNGELGPTQDQSSLEDSCIEFAQKFPVHRFRHTRIRVFGDRSGHSTSHRVQGTDYDNIEQYLRELGYQNVEICASRLVMLETSTVEAVQKLFIQNRLYICKRCTMLRRSLMATIWKKGERRLHKPKGETWTHHSDALKYWALQETTDETDFTQGRITGTNRY